MAIKGNFIIILLVAEMNADKNVKRSSNKLKEHNLSYFQNKLE